MPFSTLDLSVMFAGHNSHMLTPVKSFSTNDQGGANDVVQTAPPLADRAQLEE